MTSGPGYNAMISLIRSAVRNTVEGRDGEALASIVQARNLLRRLDGASTAPAPRMAMSAN